jgi:L-ascorbate metabolism protein UlaG (beta-lactamase superfamily)
VVQNGPMRKSGKGEATLSKETEERGTMMRIQRLSWAGILVTDGESTLMIDPLYHVNADFFGTPQFPIYPLTDYTIPDAIFVTHLHSDHFDPEAIFAAYGENIPVYVPAGAQIEAQKSKLKQIYGVSVGETIACGSLQVTATHAVDGLGDSQVSWVVEDKIHRLIHCGDTLWHGYWWKIQEQYGPFDVACLPINGAVIEEQDLTPSSEPITLIPEQAVSAAILLQAKALIPIHFGFNNPPTYRGIPDALERLQENASQRQISVLNLSAKQEWDLSKKWHC